MASPTTGAVTRLHASANTNFTDNGRRGRYGAAYLRGLAAHAGVGLTENSPDEDVDALDVTLRFARASVEVQIKCTSAFQVGNRNATLFLEEAWVRKWADRLSPIYVVLVKVPSLIDEWIEPRPAATTHKAVAFGLRFDAKRHKQSMKFSRADRLTSETLYEWRDEVYAHYER